MTAALLFLLGLALPGSSSAQDPPEDFAFPPPEAESGPAILNPASKSLEAGRLLIAVGSTRAFAYRIGEPIPVTIVLSADPDVQVNLEALKRQTLSADASDFEFAAAPVVLKEQHGRKTVWRVQLLLRSWVIKPVLVLNCDLHYATDFLPDGKTPNWKPVSTPDFSIQTSNVATDAAKDLLPGEVEQKVGAKPALVAPLRWVGYFCISILPVWVALKLIRRIRPARKLTTAESAWLEFDAIMAELAQQEVAKLSYEQVKRIAATLRSYLRIEAVPTSEAVIPLEEFFAMRDDKAELLSAASSALAKLDRVLYAKLELSEAEELVLLRELEQVVPRPVKE